MGQCVAADVGVSMGEPAQPPFYLASWLCGEASRGLAPSGTTLAKLSLLGSIFRPTPGSGVELP